MKNLLTFSLIALLFLGACSSPAYLSKTPTNCPHQDTLILSVSGERFYYYYCDSTHTVLKGMVVKKVAKSGI